MSILLMLGSGPNVVAARAFPRAAFDRIVAINNAWRVRADWDDLVHPEDFPVERRPAAVAPGQRVVTAEDYVPAQNALGGFVYGGGTMAFTASYWALHALRPRVIAYLGCDMVYPGAGNTHFYGTGAADPLRPDVTLRSLEAKSARLMALAAAQGCALVNLSQDDSRLVFPRATVAGLGTVHPAPVSGPARAQALAAEAALGYMVPSGRYWLEEARFDPAAIDRIDALWLDSLPQALRSALPCGKAA
ncbi:MAG: hypothetical protein GW886_07425 [Rhodobacterales bacterium]|nr:hypothetical protein [Rhodobacterales bacterium]NCT12399.1 hypothetical protein [Rhodobacterales bacterium]